MTTFAYTATLNDSEYIALDYAIRSYLEICRAKIAAGDRSPFLAHIEILEAMMARFGDGAEMMSARGDIWDAWHKAKAERDRKK